jgi:hypothetical protein
MLAVLSLSTACSVSGESTRLALAPSWPGGFQPFSDARKVCIDTQTHGGVRTFYTVYTVDSSIEAVSEFYQRSGCRVVAMENGDGFDVFPHGDAHMAIVPASRLSEQVTCDVVLRERSRVAIIIGVHDAG